MACESGWCAAEPEGLRCEAEKPIKDPNWKAKGGKRRKGTINGETIIMAGDRKENKNGQKGRAQASRGRGQ